MKKILFTLIACALCLGMVGAAFAQFYDTETSTGNTFTGGALDLQLSNGGPWVDTPPNIVLASATNMAPGPLVGPYDVYFKNAGTIDGKVRVTFDYTEADAAQVGEFANINVSAADYAAKVIVYCAFLDGGATNVALYWGEQVINEAYGGIAANAIADGGVVDVAGGGGFHMPTIYGLSKITLKFGPPGGPEVVWAPGAEHSEVFYLVLSCWVGNEYQLDGIDITLTATLLQYPDLTP